MSRLPGELILKDPSADEPQGFDWTDYLAELGAVTITTSTWTITGPDALLTQHDKSIVAGSLKTQVYLTAGTLGTRYIVTNQIVTNSSPTVTDERSFEVLVQNR